MRFFVLTQDGQRYGPADIPTLNQWIVEGRIPANQWLEQEGTGQRLIASAVPGLFFLPAAESSVPVGFSQAPGYYNRGPIYGQTYGGQFGGSSELSMAWVLGVIGLLCFPPTAIVGIIMANRARKAGHPSATAAIIFNWIVLGLGVCGAVLMFSILRMI